MKPETTGSSCSQITKISKKSGWHDPIYSPDCKYFIDEYSSISTLPKTVLCENNGKKLSIINENKQDTLKEYQISIPEFLTINTEDSQKLNGWILKPLNFDKNKKYPLLIVTYGGPGSQKVKNKWKAVSLWSHLPTQKGYIVACVDNRGTSGMGANFKKYVYKKLGQLDVQDQITAAKYLGSLQYINSDRIGIYGWSYGGYMALMCLLQGNDVFKMAVSVAPVTDWRFYDSIYTECFMQTPALNPEGYKFGSVMNYADQLEGKLLLVHGMADDNVHFQNSVELTEELIRYDKQFDIMFYPGYKHSIARKKEHVFKKITDFILENL